MWKKIKETLSNAKQSVTMALVGGFVVATSSFAGAEGTADAATVTSITSAFDNIKATALAALAAIAVIGIVIFGGKYAWVYGKKIFNVISK
jgi:hypothetical protein